MRYWRWAQVGRFGLAMAAAAVLLACAPQQGTKRDAFSRPLRDDYLQLVSVSDRVVEVDSAGRVVRAAAPDGHCISIDSIQTLGASVFMLIDGCKGGRSDFSGVVSLSISTGPIGGDLASMEAAFKAPGGAVALGYGGDAEDVSLTGLKRADGALYASVQDMSEFGPAFAGDEICRAFMELNGRMVVATIISRRDDPRAPGALQADMARIVKLLRRENA